MNSDEVRETIGIIQNRLVVFKENLLVKNGYVKTQNFYTV